MTEQRQEGGASGGSDELSAARAEALADYRGGKFHDAIAKQLAVVNRIGSSHPDSADDQMRLAGYFFGLGDHAATLKVLQQVDRLRPNDANVLSNLGTVLSRLHRYGKAYEILKQAVELAPDMVNVHDALARVASRIGHEDEGRRHGEMALTLKDAAAARSKHVFPIPPAIAPFSYEEPLANVIAFSLWGDQKRYLDGALRNARAAVEIYPGWRCRFFCDDTVPEQVRQGLAQAGADIVMMERKQAFDGLFWGFLVINDGRTKRFLIRDADSVINVRERVAVDEWLASDKAFHVMRDFWTHTEVILAGMWGGVGGILPPLNELLAKFRPDNLENWHLDQWFLRQIVWPTVRQSCLIHDSIYGAFGARDFPTVGRLPPNRHVGQNLSAVQDRTSRQPKD